MIILFPITTTPAALILEIVGLPILHTMLVTATTTHHPFVNPMHLPHFLSPLLLLLMLLSLLLLLLPRRLSVEVVFAQARVPVPPQALQRAPGSGQAGDQGAVPRSQLEAHVRTARVRRRAPPPPTPTLLLPVEFVVVSSLAAARTAAAVVGKVAVCNEASGEERVPQDDGQARKLVCDKRVFEGHCHRGRPHHIHRTRGEPETGGPLS
mmetsp:Transcript_66505/g.134038  ORF Transcript_66505/g.134038 Transcript_66505/m.134038 type:complete len:209 (+) Transcript_66505:645-1271(+)